MEERIEEKIVNLVTMLDKKMDMLLQRVENLEKAYHSYSTAMRELENRVVELEKNIITINTTSNTRELDRINGFRVADVILVGMMAIIAILPYIIK